MHIGEGILSVTPHGQAVLIAGAAAAAVGTGIGLWKMDGQRVPRVALLSAAFFVVSAIQVPVPHSPSSMHLMLTGLMGLVLGWAAFPAVLTALVLQAAFAAMGGPTTLGLNTLTMALPAVACHYLFRGAVRSDSPTVVFLAGFAAGATAIVLGSLLVAGALAGAGGQFRLAGLAVFAWQLPLAAVEGLITGRVAVLLRKVRPEVFDALAPAPAPQEAGDG